MQFYRFQMPNNSEFLRGVIKAYKFIVMKLIRKRLSILYEQIEGKKMHPPPNFYIYASRKILFRNIKYETIVEYFWFQYD